MNERIERGCRQAFTPGGRLRRASTAFCSAASVMNPGAWPLTQRYLTLGRVRSALALRRSLMAILLRPFSRNNVLNLFVR